MSRAPKTPQEKKALSLKKDRRNRWGNNDKAARKIIVLRKAKETRRVRHRNNQAVQTLDPQDEARASLTESNARSEALRRGGWRKDPDEPLGDVIAQKLRRRRLSSE
jgi:hypothetical protein